MDAEWIGNLLRFATGSNRVPVEGFEPAFTITKAGGGEGGSEALPHSHTCFNQLVLPDYGSEVLLREKLSVAVASCKSGFFLT